MKIHWKTQGFFTWNFDYWIRLKTYRDYDYVPLSPLRSRLRESLDLRARPQPGVGRLWRQDHPQRPRQDCLPGALPSGGGPPLQVGGVLLRELRVHTVKGHQEVAAVIVPVRSQMFSESAEKKRIARRKQFDNKSPTHNVRKFKFYVMSQSALLNFLSKNI